MHRGSVLLLISYVGATLKASTASRLHMFGTLGYINYRLTAYL